MSRRPPRRSPAPPDPGSTWEADLSPVAITIDSDPAARPALLLVVADGYILGGDVVSRPSALSAQIAATLAEGIRAAIANARGAPRVVHVRHETVAAELGKLLALDGIAVQRMAALPGVDAALEGFDRMVVGRAPEMGPRPHLACPETWAGWGLAAEQLGRFFAAAAAYYRAAPWRNITNEDVVRAKVRGGGSWSATVMGMAGELYGLALYSHHEDLLALLDGDPDRPGEAIGAVKGPVLSLSYDRRAEVPRAMRKEVRDAGWEIAGPSAYPSLIAMNTPGGAITPREMDDVIVLLEAIPRFARAHEPMLAGLEAPRYPIRWRGKGVSIVFEGAPDRFA